MAANRGAVDHVLPVVSQSQIDQRLQQCIPDALLGPAPEPNIDRVPLAIAFMHVPPRAAYPQNMQHAVEKEAIVTGWSCPSAALGRQKSADHRPLFIRQIAPKHRCFRKAALNQNQPN